MKMPRYVYECSKCNGQFMAVHGMSEIQEVCELCYSHTSELRKIPQMTYVSKPVSESAQNVKNAIEDNRKILKEAIKEVKGKEYDD